MSGLTIVDEFYLPCLESSVQYDRIAGYFSSAALAIAARGVSALIEAQGRMRLLASPSLTSRDAAELQRAYSEAGLVAALQTSMDELEPNAIDDLLIRDHAKAMLWMLANGRLEIKLVVPNQEPENDEEGIFHQKVGIFTDQFGDSISFSGSVNETARAWTRNIENFKVFRSWVSGQSDYVGDDIETFDRYWLGLSDKALTVPLPEAIRQHLVERAPKSLDELTLVPSGSRHVRPREPVKRRDPRQGLREYQEEAVENWIAADCHGILEMATGTGKTRTAIACAAAVRRNGISQLTVVAVPQKHLAPQWTRDLENAFPDAPIIEAHSDSIGWESKALAALSDLAAGIREHVILVATHASASSKLPGYLADVSGSVGTLLLIGDECHGLGARKTRAALSHCYTHRLGLSATPDRLYDDEGTLVLQSFFGQRVYEFGIGRALDTIDPITGRTVLCPYEYHPRFVTLSGDELEEYVRLTEKIYRQLRYLRDESTRDEWLEKFLFERAKITKQAGAKIDALASILESLGSDLRHCLIYCLNSEQVAEVSKLLSQRGIVFSHFDGETPMQKREQILDNLAHQRIQAVVAMKCLDEGVDVPVARIGIILASSTNPREFIQRRGRLLRQAEGKAFAVVYDLAIMPAIGIFDDPGVQGLELRVFRRELERIEEFAKYALNAGRTYVELLKIEQQLRDAGYGSLEGADE